MYEIPCYKSNGDTLNYLTQWDLGQILYFHDLGVDAAPTVHFHNKMLRENEAVITSGVYSSQTGKVSVEVPNIMLQRPYPIDVYIYVEGTGTTIYTCTIPVKAKAQPVNYQYTDNLPSLAYGAPRGTFEDDSDLSGKGSGIYLKVKDGDTYNGYVYYWNGSTLSDPLVLYQAVQLVDGSVTSNAIADNAVVSGKINDGAVDTSKLADDAVTNAKLTSNAVETGNIKDGAVTTDKIANGGVTDTKLADNAVTTGKINNGSVTSDKLASNAVTENKVADGAITAAKLAVDVIPEIYIGTTDKSSTENGTSTQVYKKHDRYVNKTNGKIWVCASAQLSSSVWQYTWSLKGNLYYNPTLISYTLTASGWNNSGLQELSISGYTTTNNTKADMQISETELAKLESDGCDGIYIVTNENNNGKLIAHAIGLKPTQNITVQILLSEVLSL